MLQWWVTDRKKGVNFVVRDPWNLTLSLALQWGEDKIRITKNIKSNWTTDAHLNKRKERRSEAAQMKFLRNLLGITKLDKEKNPCIKKKTGAQNTLQEIKHYQKKWLQHVYRKDTNRIPKQALQNKPKRRRKVGRPMKRWRDQLHLEDQRTGNTPNPSGTWWWWHTLETVL